MTEIQTRLAATIIAFPTLGLRPQRPELSPDEPRGEILLFTGVRYERLDPTPEPSRPVASDGQPRAGSRRRRS